MQTILDVSEMKVKKSSNQSNTITPKHVRYDIKITRADNGKQLSFEFQCNPRYIRPNLDNCMWSIVIDALAYEICSDDIDYFSKCYGLTTPSECIKTFNDCKKAYNDLLDFCGSKRVYEWLKDHYEGY